MMGLTYEDIVNRIKEDKGLSDEEIKLRIKEKLNKLSGLISNEGAAHIVANELGMNLLEHIKKTGLKINRLMSGMRGVGVLGKVIRSYGVREFVKEGRSGKVGSFLIGDETGLLRVVLWDTNLIKEMEENKVQEGIILRARNGYVKENNGYKELHLGNQSELIVNPPGEAVEVNGHSREFEFARKKIKDLNGNEFNLSLVGTIVQVFEIKFFEACNECGKKIIDKNCADHGIVAGKYLPVLNFFLDDGTSSIRVVAFRNIVNDLLGLNEEETLKFKDNLNLFEELRNKLLGKQIMAIGKVNKNEMFNRIEFTANKIEEIDAKEILKDLADQIAI